MSEAQTIKELQDKIADLSLVVKKQSELLAKTGQQVLSLQVDKTKQSFNSTAPSASSKLRNLPPTIDTSDFATNEDIIQLAGELQGQLELIEERSIRRLINSKKEPKEILAPLPNSDGEEPPLEHFPKNIDDFINISKKSLLILAKFYDLLQPTTEEISKYEQFVENNEIQPVTDVTDIDESQYSEVETNDCFDQLARFLGLTVRRNTDVW